MKTFLLTLAIVLAPIISLAGEIIAIDTTESGRVIWQVEAFNSGTEFARLVYTAFYEDGSVCRTGEYNSLGERIGIWKTYYKNGVPHSIKSYKGNALHGSQKMYNKEGKMVMCGEYKNGKKHGKFIQYDKSGTNIIYTKYYKKNELEDI